MQAIKQLSKQIQDQQAVIARLDAEIERVESKLGEVDGLDHALSELKERRKAAIERVGAPLPIRVGVSPNSGVGPRSSREGGSGQREGIAELDAEIARIEQAKAEAARQDGLAALKERRKAVLVDALKSGSKADTATIDKQIAAAEKRRDADAVAIEADREAVDLLKSAREEAHDSLATLEAERIEAVSAHLLAKHDAAQARYFEAVAALGGPVEEMVAIERAWCAAILGKPFPARGSKALADVRETGLRVTWDRSVLRRPEVAAEYSDGYQECWFLPEWADPRNEAFGDEAAKSIAAELNSAGVGVAVAANSAPVEREKLVEIEVVRGTILGTKPGSVKRDASTGRVTSTSVSYGPGSRLAVEESVAALHVKQGFARYAADLDAERARQRIEELRGAGKASVKPLAEVE
jgi:prefoldin subunit 5